MLERMAAGSLPKKHHSVLRGPEGAQRFEQCLTREGFDGAYTILYHEHRPHALAPTATTHALSALASSAEPAPLRRHHYRTRELGAGTALLGARVPLLYSRDVTLSVAKPSAPDPAYFLNADADELFFVREGRGVVRSLLGDLTFQAHDYVCVPKGIAYRLLPEGALDLWLMECHGGVGALRQFRNEVGQLRMDAPYCHRDFRRPHFVGPIDEGIRELVIKRSGVYHGFASKHPLLDAVGWDGTVYPWAFPISAFQPRVSSVHLPPTWHGTFAARGVLICSFVPRPLDFGPDAVPCPYPHASVDVDEVLYYVSGEFSSRSGIESGSVSLHPRGIPHGPHPGRYEASVGQTHTSELAVMLDCYEPLSITPQAQAIEDPSYESSLLQT